MNPDMQQPLQVGFATLLFLALTFVGQGALRGLGVVILGQVPSLILRSAFSVTLVGVFALTALPLSPDQAVAINLAAA